MDDPETSPLDYKYSLDRRRKIGASIKSLWTDPEFCDRMRTMYDDPAWRARVSAGLKGKSKSPAHRKKIAENNRGRRNAPEVSKRAGETNAANWRNPEFRAEHLDLVAPLVVCQYCSREIRGRGNLARHERACSKNPDQPPKPRPQKNSPPRAAPTHSFIYALVDPRTSEPRYVGWTTGPQYRLKKHLKAARQEGNKTYVAYWVQGLLLLGIEPEMKILEENPLDYAVAERAWIARYRAEGYRLTNMTDGGDGGPGYRHTPETIELLRELGRRPLTPAQLAAKEALRGKPLSAETRAKISASTKGVSKPRTEAHEAALRAAAARRDHSYLVERNKTKKMRELTAARNRTPEHRAKVAAARLKKKNLFG